MPKFIIERTIPGAGNVPKDEVRAISQKANDVLSNMDPSIHWVNSFITMDKVYCVYIAPNEEMIREASRAMGFPADSVSEVKSIMDPATAEV
ncbi:MAG: DUF4242 domain-containing protein [Bacteroidota bacterium]|jgi:hypothetical protein|nr:DUF4242 domain-containing protein [Bacteroidota bacterium]